MSLLRGLPLLLAGMAIGCDARSLDPHGDAGGGSGGGGSGGGGTVDAGPGTRDVRVLEIIEPARCGDGILDSNEQCDDGNYSPGDGCNPICQIECFQSCGACGPPGPCITTTVCGDGILAPSEACDDSNLANGDGCAGTCQTVEHGWRCPVAGRRCVPNCGDGRVVGPETCDDGNAVAGDGCSDLCLAEPSGAACGDGVLSGTEECDDGPGNAAAAGYGACTTACRYGGYCGDGVLNGREQCDLGSRNNNVTYGNKDGCAQGCVYPQFLWRWDRRLRVRRAVRPRSQQRALGCPVHDRLQDHRRLSSRPATAVATRCLSEGLPRARRPAGPVAAACRTASARRRRRAHAAPRRADCTAPPAARPARGPAAGRAAAAP